MYKLTNLREFNETLNYHREQIREKGFFYYNTKLKKLSKKDNGGNKDLWPMYQTELLKDF